LVLGRCLRAKMRGFKALATWARLKSALPYAARFAESTAGPCGSILVSQNQMEGW
jgi:hypothetical protein